MKKEKDLIRRHLTLEQKADLEYKLYQLHEKVPGKRTDLQSNGLKVDIYQKIANKTGQGYATVERHIKYAKLKEEYPDKYKRMKISQVLSVGLVTNLVEGLKILIKEYIEG